MTVGCVWGALRLLEMRWLVVQGITAVLSAGVAGWACMTLVTRGMWHRVH
jgi:hypothetical protein